MRSIFFAVLSIFFVVSLPARARLGETENQCIVRYGTPTQILDPDKAPFPYRTLCFTKGDCNVCAVFLNGYCGFIFIQKNDKSDLSDNEIQALLQANADGQTWQKSTQSSTDQVWFRNDQAEARYDAVDRYLTFASKDYLTAEDARKKAAEDEKLKGF